MKTTKNILVADDDHAIRFVLERALTGAGYTTQLFQDGHQLLEVARDGIGDLVITDIVMPSGSGLDLLKSLKIVRPTLPVIIMTAHSTLLNAVQAFESGAFDYLPKPFDIHALITLTERALQQTDSPEKNRRSKQKNNNQSKEVMDVERFGGIIGSSAAMQALFRTIGRLSASEMTVLIQGESGAGKELVAKAVHMHSPRAKGPFVAVNMAAIPKDLIESELFGHEKGAFTGAVSRRIGCFEQALGGTLFLDEIGDMSLDAQTRLLRVLQDGRYSRVGGAASIRSDVRIIAATHQDLSASIRLGHFREDLFYRLNVIPLSVPPLRSRREDIPLLVDYFLARTAQEMGAHPKKITSDAMTRLIRHNWPGNVRELENLIRRMMILAPGDTIQVDRLESSLHSGRHTSDKQSHTDQETETETAFQFQEQGLQKTVIQVVEHYFANLNGLTGAGIYRAIIQRVERPLILRVLRETGGNRAKASEMLGINRNTLRKKMVELKINDTVLTKNDL